MKTLTTFIAIILLSACVTQEEYNANTAEGAFKTGQYYEENDRFEEAIIQFKDVKNRFPYSKYAIEADLKVADVYFKKEAYIEAQGSYQLFVDLHPKHSKVDYALYFLAGSLYNQLPSTIDRDLSLGPKAQRYYRMLLQRFPNSKYVPDCKAKIAKIEGSLQEKEIYIADFYFKTAEYTSALKRYQGFVAKYPKVGKASYALLRAMKSAKKIDEPGIVKEYYRKLHAEFPNSAEAKAANSEFAEYVN